MAKGDIRSAFVALPKMSFGKRAFLNQAGPLVDEADARLLNTEKVLHVAVAQTSGIGIEGIVVTSFRLAILSSSGVEYVRRSKIQSVAASSWTFRGQHLRIDAEAKSWAWWEVEPKGSAKAIEGTLRHPPPEEHANGGYLVATQGPTAVVGAGWGESAATFLGGDFVGNVARRDEGIPSRIDSKTSLKVKLSSENEVLIYASRREIARYPFSSNALSVGSEDAIGRALRKGPLAGTALATLALGPIGLVGLLGSTKRTTKQSVFIAIDDPPDYGIFALAKGALGHRIQSQRSSADRATAQGGPELPDSTSHTSGMPPAVEVLERLSALRQAGALTEEEFETKKQELLKRI